MAIDRRKLTQGSFELIDEGGKEIAMEIVAGFHYRDGSENHDGSMGRIVISPMEMNDILAYCLMRDEKTDLEKPSKDPVGSDKIEWNKFKQKTPPCSGEYLWALNNWETRDVNERRVHTSSVRILHWCESRKRFHGSGGHSYVDPDEWAEVPMPEKVLAPTVDI